MNFLKTCILFCIGGGAYVTLEFLWRGWSHYSMFLLGGLCFLLIGQLGRLEPRPGIAARTLRGRGSCTCGERLFGMIFNRDYRIWDYRRLPGNFMGQICPQFSILWIPVSLAAILLFGWLDRSLILPGANS